MRTATALAIVLIGLMVLDAPAGDSKPLTPVEAIKKVNEEVTVQMLVKAAKNRLEKRGEVYLDSEENFKDEKNLGIVVTKTGAAKFKEAGVNDPAVHFQDKIIWVKGTVIIKEQRPRIEVDGRMHVKKHRHRCIYTLAGPVCYVVKVMHCPLSTCANHRRRFSPEQEVMLAMPRWTIGWDVFCWLGHRRFARHWSVPQIRAELMDSYKIELSEDAIEDYVQRYQCMLVRDRAKPVLELDSNAKVKMRGKIRGLRGIEREVLKEIAAVQASQGPDRKRSVTMPATAPHGLDVVLDYCAAVRGIINSSQGGPLRPPGLRMSEALGEVRKSIQRNLRLKKGGSQNPCWSD